MFKCINSPVVPLVLAAICLCFPVAPEAEAMDRQIPAIWRPLAARLEQDGFSREELSTLFADPIMQYDPKPLRGKLRSLYRSAFSARRLKNIQKKLQELGFAPGKADGQFGPNTALAIEAFQRRNDLSVTGLPSRDLEQDLERAAGVSQDSRSWYNGVYDSATHPLWLAEAREFAICNRPYFLSMQRKYQVPPAVIGGIITIETRQGTFLGSKPAVVTLASMALGSDFTLIKPMFKGISLDARQLEWLKETAAARADWAYDELTALLRHTKNLAQAPASCIGSPLGAIGIAQFMPSNVAKHGVDGDGDGRVDLFTPADAIHSAGRYLHDYGWTSETVTLPQKRDVLFAYNHSQRYVNSVLAVAAHLDQILMPPPNGSAKAPIIVASLAEMLQAVRPGAHIRLQDGDYDVAAMKQTSAQYVRWIGGSPVIYGVSDLRISAPGRAQLRNAAPNAPLLVFVQCPGLILENIGFFRKNNAETQKSAPLLELQQCAHTLLRFCRFSNFLALRAKDCPDLTLEHSLIQDSNNGGLVLENCRNASLWNVVLRDNGKEPLLSALKSPGIRLRHVFLHHNESDERPMFSLGDSDVRLQECVLLRNTFKGLSLPQDNLRSSELYDAKNKFN